MRFMHPRKLAIFFVGCFFCLGFSLGCGKDGPKRYRIQGNVTFKGQPVPSGFIMFDPNVQQGNSGPQGVARITQGEFDTNAADGRGIAGGPTHIRIMGFDGASPNELNPYGKVLFSELTVDRDLPRENSTVNFELP